MSKRDLHRSGGKFAGSHTTVLDGCVGLVDIIAKMACVTKISLTVIENQVRKGGSPFTVKCMDVPGNDKALKVTMAKGASKQIIYVYVKDPVSRGTVRREVETCL